MLCSSPLPGTGRGTDQTASRTYKGQLRSTAEREYGCKDTGGYTGSCSSRCLVYFVRRCRRRAEATASSYNFRIRDGRGPSRSGRRWVYYG